MGQLSKAVLIVSSVLVIYLISISFQFSFSWIFLLFITLHFLLVWLVIKILKDPNPSTKTFERYFYEDESYQRNNPN
ncbi:MAG: hypothetical protein AAF363_04540 [Bacteroidota bacterium]